MSPPSWWLRSGTRHAAPSGAAAQRLRSPQDSTLDVAVQATRQRVSAHGAPLYEIEYLLTNDYGRKKVLTAVCIDASVLYIYALQFKARASWSPGV